MAAMITRRFLSGVPHVGAQVSRLANGITVVSQDHGEPVSTVSVYAAAGSRNETAETSGAALHLKSLPFLSTANRTNVFVAREAEANGWKFKACSGRETVGLHVHFLRKHLNAATESLTDVVTAPAFFDWEARDNAHVVEAEVAQLKACSQSTLLAHAHRGLFRGTLGRSPFTAGSLDVSADTLKAYYNSHFVGERVAVVGTGVTHGELVQAVQGLAKLPAKGAATAASKYHGNAEIREETASNQVHVAFAFPGASISQADSAAVNVLRFLLGGVGSSVKYGDGRSSSRVAAAVAAAAPGCFSLQTVHAQYSDAGLLGVLLTTSATAAGAHITAAAGAIKSVLAGVSDAELQAAKNQLSFNILSQERGAYVSATAAEALATHAHTSAAAKVAAVAKVSAADVKAAAARVLASAPVYVAKGNLEHVPYLDQLFK